MTIKIQLTGSANGALQRLHQASDNLEPAMLAISGVLADATEQAFADEADPETGEAWAELSDTTLALTPRREGGQKLQDSGQLAASIQPDYGADFALVGSNKAYAAMQHFGGTTSAKSMIPGREIPSRRYLGIGPEDEDEILAIMRGHLEEALNS